MTTSTDSLPTKISAKAAPSSRPLIVLQWALSIASMVIVADKLVGPWVMGQEAIGKALVFAIAAAGVAPLVWLSQWLGRKLRQVFTQQSTAAAQESTWEAKRTEDLLVRLNDAPAISNKTLNRLQDKPLA